MLVSKHHPDAAACLPVVDRCRKTLYQKANEILRSLQLYMKCNLLHINIKKCCYIHFKPSHSDNSAIEDEILTLNNIVIKKVAETKFLGVIIDDQLSWKAHIQSLNSKLKCEIGKLCRIRHVIPEKHHKELYHALFESHLRFGISVWGGVSNNRLEPIFVTQKKCIRILFGDLEAYLDKFKKIKGLAVNSMRKNIPSLYSRKIISLLFTISTSTHAC